MCSALLTVKHYTLISIFNKLKDILQQDLRSQAPRRTHLNRLLLVSEDYHG